MKSKALPKQFPERVLVMFSGGIDSTTLLYLLKDKVKKLRAVTINYGQLDFEQSIAGVNRTSIKLDIPVEVIDVPNLSRSFAGLIEDTHDGYRILQTEVHTKTRKQNKGDDDYHILPVTMDSCMTTSMAGVYATRAGFNTLSEGVNKDDLTFYPTRTRIHKHLTDLFSIDSYKFSVFTPFIDMSRSEVMELAIKLKVEFDDTRSCWERGIHHCGKCRGCLSRMKRFSDAGIKDLTIYKS